MINVTESLTILKGKKTKTPNTVRKRKRDEANRNNIEKLLYTVRLRAFYFTYFTFKTLI